MFKVKPYIMTWRGGADADVDTETRIVVYGPFNTEKEAVSWADDSNEDDDPRWQLVMLSAEYLTDKHLLVPILSTV